MDIPENCSGCKFFNEKYYHSECLLTNKIKGYTFKSSEGRMEDCPIKILPKERDYSFGDSYYDGFDNGWNACIQEIVNLGDI